MWHHICFTWESTNGDWNFYKDGVLAKVGSRLQAGHVIEEGGCLVLGQLQRNACSDFENSKGFVGFLANLNIWDHVLSRANITELSNYCWSGVGNAVQWLDFIDDLREGVQKVRPSTCQPQEHGVEEHTSEVLKELDAEEIEDESDE